MNNTGTLNLYVNLTFGASSVGTLNLKAGGTLQDYAVLTNPQKNILNNYGTISINSGATLVNAFGIIYNAGGTLTLASGSSYDFTGGIFNDNGTLNLDVNFTLGDIQRRHVEPRCVGHAQ